MKKVQSVSIPRTGHHLLVNCLNHYFGEDLKYCNFYGCCKTIGCPHGGNFQKTMTCRYTKLKCSLYCVPMKICPTSFNIDETLNQRSTQCIETSISKGYLAARIAPKVKPASISQGNGMTSCVFAKENATIIIALSRNG